MKLKRKKRINLEAKNYKVVKSRVSDQDGLYQVDVSATHSTLPLDSIICGEALQILRNFPDGFVDLIVTSPPVRWQTKGIIWWNISRQVYPMVFADLFGTQARFKKLWFICSQHKGGSFRRSTTNLRFRTSAWIEKARLALDGGIYLA